MVNYNSKISLQSKGLHCRGDVLYAGRHLVRNALPLRPFKTIVAWIDVVLFGLKRSNLVEKRRDEERRKEALTGNI